MAADPMPPEMQAKLDAWVNSIRGLARQHGVAHRTEIGRAVKEVNLARSKPVLLETVLNFSMAKVVYVGVPEEEVRAIRTLIFG